MGPFVQPPPGPVFVLPPSAGALQITGAAIEVPSGDILTLDRQLLSITDRVVSAGSLLSVPGSLTSTTTGVLLFVDPSVVSTSGFLLSVAGVLSLKGGFFEDVLGTFNVGGNLLGVTGDLTTTASTALLKLDRTSVTSATDLIRVSGGGTLDLAGPLLDAKNATFALGGRLVVAEGHEAIVRRASNPPPANTFFVALDFSLGGHLTAGTTQPNAIVARGFATHNYVDPDFGSIVLGTDEPIVHQGGKPMLDVTAARTDLTAPSFDVDVTGSAVFVDTALLDASAPLIGLTGAAMRTSGDVINIFQRARVEREVGSLIHLDRSRLDVVNGNLVGVSGGSLLRTANLLTMANGSRVNILNGALLSVLGNSYASIAGCLVCFTGANNVLTITNSMPATGTLFGFPIAGTVQVGAGATAASVFPGLGVNGNALNVTSGVLVNVGPGSTLKLQ
jgi:hypothetical protein